MKVGDRVKIKEDIYEHPDGDSPGGYCARQGDIVVIRNINHETHFVWNHSVSHEDRTDGATFLVDKDEIEEIE